MPVHTELTALAIVILAALVCGMVMTRLKQPAVVGYILAGVILGPSIFADGAGREQITFLAELGVLMLLFFIGMELSLRSFRVIWKTAVAATLLQIAIGLLVMAGLSFAFDWSWPMAVLLAFVVALSSTAVVVRMLEQMNILRGDVGQLTLGVLIAQDMAVVPMMLVVNSFGGGEFGPWDGGRIVLGMLFLFLLVWYLSRRHRISLPFSRFVAGNVDLTALAGLVYCFGAAAITGLLGLSPAYGAFLAGLVIGNSTARPVMIRATRPIQGVLLMLFFLSIGLLIDLDWILANIWAVVLLLLFVTVFKTIFNIAILRLLREPWPHAFIAGLMLAQVGEFSFIVGTTGVRAGVITPEQNNLIVAVAAFSLLFGPLWQTAVRRLMRMAMVRLASLDDTVRVAAGRRGFRLLLAAIGAGRRTVAGARRLGGWLTGRRRLEAPDTPPEDGPPAEGGPPLEGPDPPPEGGREKPPDA